MTDSNGSFTLVANLKGLRTSSEKQNAQKMFWGYDNKDRTDGNFKGFPSGLYAHSYDERNVLANRYYVLRSENSNGWTAGGDTAPTGKNGPTYIFKRFTDYHTGNDTAVAQGKSEYNLIKNEYKTWASLEAAIKADLVVKVNGTATTNYTLTSTADPTTVGQYLAYVNYNGYTLGVIKIKVREPAITSIEVDSTTGKVTQNAADTAQTGSTLTVTYENGVVEKVKVTVGMLKDSSGNAVSTASSGTKKSLTIVYKDKQITNYTLRVIDKNYPEYPDPGSVKVSKEGQEVEFAQTGAANVELSATGMPLVEGIDIIVMLDTSSSMSAGTTGDGVARHTATYAAVNKLIQTLKADIASGVLGNTTKIAIADFNGYKTPKGSDTYATKGWGGYYALDGNAWVRDKENPNNKKLHYDQEGYMNVPNSHGARTGTGGVNNLTANAFVNVTSLPDDWANEERLPLSGGTNYDFAMDAIYQLGYRIKEDNLKNDRGDRELVVIFLSDGCPFQYNYWMSHANNKIWNFWLQGELNTEALTGLTGSVDTFRHFYNPNGKHWMAEAIKGDPNKTYKVIRKSDEGLEGVIKDLKLSPGGEQYMGYLPGLGTQIHTIALGIIGNDSNIWKTSMDHVLRNISSDPNPKDDVDEFYYNVNHSADLEAKFQQIATTVVQAATQSYFLDTMGEKYDLYMSDKILKSDGTVLEGVVPAIEVRDYPVNNNTRSTEPEKVLERITFGGDYRNAKVGDTVIATSSIKGDISFTMGDLLQGKYVYYNTSKTETKTVNYSGKTITLAPETFFYITTTLVANTEFALNYYVYLEDALDVNGDNIAVDAGTYNTNKSAKLYYKNYLNNDCTKETVSPKFSWEDAKVSYGFYLVDENGSIIKDQTTGKTTENFNERIPVVDPKLEDLLEEFDLNTSTSINSKKKAAELADKLSELGYELYVNTGNGVTYSVDPNSGDLGGKWTITGDTTGTTYVTGHDGENASKKTENTNAEHDYTNTTVWFAVVVKLNCEPDTIVVDFGLPVAIDVLSNDAKLGTVGTLEGIGTTKPQNLKPINASNQTLETNFAGTLTTGTTGLRYGTAEVKNGKVVYKLDTMEMNKEESFYYALNYKGSVGTNGFYYSTVTVIPATTIYYEDSFVSYTAWNASNFSLNRDPDNQWKPAAEATTGEQAQDRPGSLSANDADNIYGYDGAYTNMAQYSMGSAMKFTANNEVFGEAQFTFWGTGFDVISLTSNTTGTISVNVYDADAFDEKQYEADSRMFMVDTYYGYKYVLCDVIYEWDVTAAHPDGHWARVSAVESKDTKESKPNFPENPQEGDRVEGVEMTWIVDQNASDALYQVPVMKVSGLEYKRYTVIIAVYYMEGMDHREENGTKSEFDFYLDAIRIYDPANDGANSDVIKKAYEDDGEGWPEYFELRNLLISRNDFDSQKNGTGSGIVFIDNTQDENKNITYTIEDYKNFGPNNELYLAPGQAVAFKLNVTDKNLAQIHLAMKSVGNGTAKATVYDASDKSKTNKLPGDIKTATDLYYDITSLNGRTVVISNPADSTAILSITNVKVTYKAQHTDSLEADFFSVDTQAVDLALASLMGLNTDEEENDVTEPSEPDVTEPSEPDVTEPSEPDVTEPSEPDVTGPSEPDVTEPSEPSEPEKAADTGELEKSIAKAKALKKADYSTKSWNAMEAALKLAEQVLADADASQEEVDTAADALNKAIKALVPTTGKSPETGDSAPIVMVAVIGTLALAGIVVLLVSKKKSRK